ncbi:hypothetical protein HGRIS_000797 [Hohenbuehelia grisea]|uniref:Leucine Rich repeats (2 copies) n=1 Tax=Hohenbuehelia grisea TaxID=104357 RepID=A0ABR3IPR3_9AGAR
MPADTLFSSAFPSSPQILRNTHLNLKTLIVEISESMAFDDIISMPALKPFVLAFALCLLATVAVFVQFRRVSKGTKNVHLQLSPLTPIRQSVWPSLRALGSRIAHWARQTFFLYQTLWAVDFISEWSDSVIRAYGPAHPDGVGILPLLEPEKSYEMVTPPPKMTVLREILDRALHIRLDAPQKVDEESHKSELKKVESLLAGSLAVDQLVVQARYSRHETAYAVQLFNDTLEAAFQSTGLLDEVKLAIVPPIDLPGDTVAIRSGADLVKDWHEHGARVLPWWQKPKPEQPQPERPQPDQPKPDLSALKNLRIRYPMPIDECIELLSVCPALCELYIEWVVAPRQPVRSDLTKLVCLSKLRTMTIRSTVDLGGLFGVIDVPNLRALDLTLNCQTSPDLYDIQWDDLQSVRIQGIPGASSEREIRNRLHPQADIQLTRAVK